MDVQWHMSNLFGLISLYALARTAITGKYWLLFLFSGTLAALCNFTGLMVFPVAALVLLADRSAHSWRLPMLAIIAGICFLYVSHEKNSHQFVFSALQQSPDWQVKLYIIFDTLQKMIPYMMRYLASPLSRDWLTAGYCLAAAGTALTAYYWIMLIRDGKQLSNLQRLCLYLSTTIIASAFFTAFGRIIYPNSATAERYQTLVLPWLPALYGMILPDIRDRLFSLIASVSWIISFSIFLLPSQMSSARDMVILSSRVNQAHTAARAGVLEQPYITVSLSYPLIKNGINSVKDNDKFLRSHSLGYFQHLPQFAVDKNYEIDQNLPACTGYTAKKVDENTDSLSIDGRLLHQGKPVTDIILLQKNNVIGVGTLVGSDESLLPPAWQDADSSRFRAFMRADRIQTNEIQTGENQIFALGVMNHEPVCQYALHN